MVAIPIGWVIVVASWRERGSRRRLYRVGSLPAIRVNEIIKEGAGAGLR